MILATLKLIPTHTCADHLQLIDIKSNCPQLIDTTSSCPLKQLTQITKGA